METPLEALAKALERGDLEAARSAALSLRKGSLVNNQVAAEVLHELRQPLFGIKAYIQLLRDDGQLSGQLPMAQLLAQVERMELIIADFTRIATDKPAPKEPINLSAHAQRARQLFCDSPESARVSVELVAAPEVEIDGNGRLIEQLVLNLLNNARDAISGSGKIKLVITRESGIPTLYVADWGPGIPQEIRHRIFEPYVTSKAGGSGLGLAVCQRIAQEHGAKIGLAPGYVLNDVPAPTTVFQVAFTEAARPNVQERPRVLLVDDEAIIRMVFRDLLSKEMELVDVEDAEEALEHLKLRDFDLIVSDKNLPGLSGLDLAKEARRLNPASRVILMTGYPSLITAQQAIELGVIEYLVKPFDDIREVREKIRSALKAPPPPAYQRQGRRVDVYEDNPATARQVSEALAILGMEARVLTEPVPGGDELPAGVVVSWDFAAAHGRRAVEIGRTMGRGAPFVVLAEHLTMEAALESLRGGAVACLPKLLSDVKALSRELSRALKL